MAIMGIRHENIETNSSASGFYNDYQSNVETIKAVLI